MTTKKSIAAFFCMMTLWITPCLQGLILPWPELKSLCSRLELVGDNDLVVFDVDETLIIPDDMILRRQHVGILESYRNKLKDFYPEDSGSQLISQVMLQRKASLIEPEVLKLNQLLQGRAVKVIALTAMNGGPLGDIASLADWRYQELKQLGLDFSGSFPEIGSLSFGSLSDGSEPLYWKGILCSDTTSKGVVLKSFLEELNWKPRRVIVLDDLIENLQMIEKEMHTMGIGVLGLHYTKAEHLLSPLDPAVVDLQFSYLMESGEWLSDGEAYRIIYEKQIAEETSDLEKMNVVEKKMDVFSLALKFFIIANPIGNIPAMLSVVRQFPFEKQRAILFREAIYALLIALFFLFIGEAFLKLLELSDYTVSICGGFLLFIVALQMIFPTAQDDIDTTPQQDPFIVPIATPLITGGGLMSTIMIFSSSPDISTWTITAALLVAWVAITFILREAPYVQKLLGKRGLIAMEQLMGMILAMISMQLIVTGIQQFIKG